MIWKVQERQRDKEIESCRQRGTMMSGSVYEVWYVGIADTALHLPLGRVLNCHELSCAEHAQDLPFEEMRVA